MSTSHSESNQSRGGVDVEAITNEPPSKKPRGTSFVWKHFEKVRDDDNKEKAQCKHCHKFFAGGSGTSSLGKHIKHNACPNYTYHGIGERRKTEGMLDQLNIRRDFAVACIKHNYPFNIGEHAYFDKFLKGLNPNFSLPSTDTIQADVIQVYKEEKVKIHKLLNELRCKVSLTMDIWTLDHSDVAYCCLTSHFIDDDWVLQGRILSFKKIPYLYDDDHLFDFFKDVIVEWDLSRKIFSVVVDNASANDVVLGKLQNWLVGFNGDFLHVKCNAHILNLIVQDGLKEIGGFIEKIRETVRYLAMSPYATQNFETALHECNLECKRKIEKDVANRWNSTYELIETVLPLKAAFSRLQETDENYHFNPCEFEWAEAEIIHKCLKVFYEASRNFSSSNYPTSNVFFPDICAIQLKMIEWKNSENEFVKKISEPMRYKFDKYWNECCVVLGVAVVFDPRFKMHLVKFLYSKIYKEHASSYIESVRNTLEDLFMSYGGSLNNQSVMSSSSNTEKDSLYDFDRYCEESSYSVIPKSELDTYLCEARFPRKEPFDILDWWKVNSPRLPVLAKIARDVLALPATTVVSDAAFNVGGRVIDESRACLGPDAIEALVATDDWIEPIGEKDVGDVESPENQAESVLRLLGTCS